MAVTDPTTMWKLGAVPIPHKEGSCAAQGAVLCGTTWQGLVRHKRGVEEAVAKCADFDARCLDDPLSPTHPARSMYDSGSPSFPSFIMAHINTSAREITAKIVYYGPGLCGKTTNVEYIHKKVPPQSRGRMMSLATVAERTLLFDLLPVDAGEIGGYKLRYQLSTVPGQVYYNAARRLVLQNVSGIVFVADSDPARLEANIESMYNLYENLAELKIDPADVPLVIQYNKRDLSGALPLDTLQNTLNPELVPAWEAVAIKGIGVFETLGEAMRLVEARLRTRFA